ncbi:MAG: DMT family transporter [Synechococcus sp.]|nr:DMT family transporter [Synechococcus sp.]
MRRLPPWALPVGIYVLLRGLDAIALKALQLQGLRYSVNGENPISFCNVFFFSQLAVGLLALGSGGKALGPALRSLTGADRLLLAADAFLGVFLGPVAYYLALQSLTVISQTLLFALVLPVSALLARWLLREPLPRAFLPSLLLIAAGLLLPQLSQAAMGGRMDEAVGVLWALVGVLCFSSAALTGRSIAARRWPPALSVGLGSLTAALVFAVLALLLYGPQHFLLLRLWWVAGVILLYALTLSLGSELALRRAYRHAGVATVSLWGSLSIVVAVAGAVLLLGEPIRPALLGGVALLMAGVWLAQRPGQSVWPVQR